MLGLHLRVPLLNFFIDPECKLSAENGVNHVRQPLARQLRDLLVVGQICQNFRALDYVIHHRLHRNSLVLRTVNVLELVAFQGYT